MKGKYHTLNIVLTVLFVVLLMGNIPSAIAAAYSYGKEQEWSRDYEKKYELVGDMSLELIGDEYKEEKRRGYLYYRLVLPVENIGRHNLTADDVYVQMEGANYSDVYQYSEPFDAEGNLLIWENKEIIPSMQQGGMEKVFQIKKGTEQVQVTVYMSSEDYFEEKNGETVTFFLGE